MRELTTYGRTHAVRIPDYEYADDADIHVTLYAAAGTPFRDRGISAMVCENVVFYTDKLHYRLYGFTLMPDHLHALFSPADSGTPLSKWLQDFKSYTTRQYQRQTGQRRLWQESAYDHVCRSAETAEQVLAYIVNNPVRGGLVERWQDWPWTKVFIEM